MTRRESPVAPPVVLTIAGSDSGGGAGIQADVKTIEACGGFATSAITSVTAQNTRGVERVQNLPIEDVAAQISAVLDDFDVAAVKTGMPGTRAVIELLAERASEFPNLVVDPLLVATSGDRLLDPSAETAYPFLIEGATLVTPNADEATALTGVTVEDATSAAHAARVLVSEMGADAALVTGGHLSGNAVVDTLVHEAADGVRTIRHDRIDTDATHGAGCTLSSAIATRLAQGDALETAVDRGVALLARAVRYNVDVGGGPGPVHHLVELRDDASRTTTADLVGVIASRMQRSPLPSIVPQTGCAIAGATPSADVPGDVAAVVGRLQAKQCQRPHEPAVRFGADDPLASVLLAVREGNPQTRFAALVDGGRSAIQQLDVQGRFQPALAADIDGTAPLSGEILEPLRRQSTAPTAMALFPAEPRPDEEQRIIVFAESSSTLLDRLDRLPSG